MLAGGSGFASGFGVVAGDDFGSSFIGVVSRVIMNLRLYGDSVSLGSVNSRFGSAWNIRLRQSSVQYRSSGVDRRGSSSLFITAAGSTRTTS